MLTYSQNQNAYMLVTYTNFRFDTLYLLYLLVDLRNQTILQHESVLRRDVVGTAASECDIRVWHKQIDVVQCSGVAHHTLQEKYILKNGLRLSS